MDRKALETLLRKVRSGGTSVKDAAEQLSALETESLGFARLDRHREARRGMPEVVFGEGKSAEQIRGIVERLSQGTGPVLVTRIEETIGRTLAEEHPRGEFDALGRTFLIPSRRRRKPRAGLLIITAGTSDLPVAREALVSARAFGLAPTMVVDVGVAGIHRLFEHQEAMRQAKVLIVVAGMEGALPSVVAGLVQAPVIGVPTSVGYGAAMGGMTALYCMLSSCAGGLTVVNIDNGFGAACAARTILN